MPDWENISSSVVVQGDLTQLQCSLIEYTPFTPGKKKPLIGFSAKSRLSMLRMTSRLDWNKIKCGLFITVTYPDELLPRDKERRKRDRMLFFRDMEKYLGREISLIWRVEWKRRKSGKRKGELQPHHHFLVFGVRWWDKEEIEEAWKRAIGWNRKVSVDVDKIGNKRKQAIYIAKYAAKMPEFGTLDYATYRNIDGRHWGYSRPRLLPKATKVSFHDLPHDIVHRLRCTAASELPDYRLDTDTGFSLFGKFGKKLAEEVMRLCLDAGCQPDYT